MRILSTRIIYEVGRLTNNKQLGVVSRGKLVSMDGDELGSPWPLKNTRIENSALNKDNET